MENTAANGLPEIDSLPDGFVEGSAEPQTPSNEHEFPLDGCKDFRIMGSDSLGRSTSGIAENIVSVEGKVEKSQKTAKLRTFPVPLSEKDGYDASGESTDVSHDGENKEATLVRSESSASASASSIGSELRVNLVDVNQRDLLEPKCSAKGGLDKQADREKGTSSSECQKNQKEVLQDPAEQKRKSSKRSFKTEKEFLEFTLKYQHLLAERDSAIAVRDKLESLCRELQRQNKMLMDECKRVSEEGQNLRLDLSTRFNDAIKEVSSKLEEQKGDCLSQLKENEMLRDKLKQFADQYALSEQQHAQQLKQKELEIKISELKIQQHEEKMSQEQAQMKLYSEQVSQLLATEKSLRLQLKADGEKFQQFQDALQKSNEVFETFKQEIEKMSKSMKELKKENSFLKSKCDKSDYTLVQLVEEREHMKMQLEKTKNQKEKLESLCRSLQAERKQSSTCLDNAGSALQQP